MVLEEGEERKEVQRSRKVRREEVREREECVIRSSQASLSAVSSSCSGTRSQADQPQL